MGGYVRQFDVTVTHPDGERITAILKPAKWGDVSHLGKGANEDEIVRGFQATLGEYIVELRGPTDAAGVQVTKEEFLSAAYFVPAVLEIGTEWIQRATPRNPPSPGA